MRDEIRILVADDHGIVRMGLIQMIKQLQPKAKLSEVDDYKSLNAIILKESFDLAIIDVNMPNGTLQEAIHFIKKEQPQLKILVFSSQDENVYALRYLKMGADGFLNKLSSKEKIDKAITSMLQKGRFLSDEIQESIIYNTLHNKESSSPLEVLSNRELEIAQKLAEGLPLKELSYEMKLHNSTISTYKSRIFKKLDIQSIPELIGILELYN